MVLLDLVKLDRKYQAILLFCVLYLSRLSRLVFILVCRRFLIKYFSCKNITRNHTLICPSILFYSNVQKFQNVTVLLTLNGNKESKKSDQEIKIPQYFLECNENVQMMTILALSKIGFLAMHFLFDTYIE